MNLFPDFGVALLFSCQRFDSTRDRQVISENLWQLKFLKCGLIPGSLKTLRVRRQEHESVIRLAYRLVEVSGVMLREANKTISQHNEFMRKLDRR